MNIDGRVMKYSVVKMFNVCLVGLERKVMAAFLLGVDSLRGLTGDAHTVPLSKQAKVTKLSLRLHQVQVYRGMGTTNMYR